MKSRAPSLPVRASEMEEAIGRMFIVRQPPSATEEIPPGRLPLVDDAGPLTRLLWRLAIAGIEHNIVETEDGRYFGAGAHFGVTVFTRDLAFSGILGLNRLYPELMYASLEVARQVRWRLGFKVAAGYATDLIPVDWDVVAEDEHELRDRFHTNSYARRTDDVIWLWAAGDLAASGACRQANWQWVYDWGRRFFERFYHPFFDPADGLYRGQASFVDIHFPAQKTGGYPRDWPVEDCLAAKATSTNALYILGLETMAMAAKGVARSKEAIAWRQRAEKLRDAMRQELRQADGTFVYLKDRWGHPIRNRHNLGEALAVIAGVVEGETAARALANYPHSVYGVPLFAPFFGTDTAYHDNSSWPFADTFWLRALEQATGESQCALNASMLAHACPDSFRELTDYRTHEPKGSPHQLWSAAAYIDVCRRAGLLG